MSRWTLGGKKQDSLLLLCLGRGECGRNRYKVLRARRPGKTGQLTWPEGAVGKTGLESSEVASRRLSAKAHGPRHTCPPAAWPQCPPHFGDQLSPVMLSSVWATFIFSFLFTMLGIKSGTSSMLSKHSTHKLHHWLLSSTFCFTFNIY